MRDKVAKGVGASLLREYQVYGTRPFDGATHSQVIAGQLSFLYSDDPKVQIEAAINIATEVFMFLETHPELYTAIDDAVFARIIRANKVG